jgi:hypothetical protein
MPPLGVGDMSRQRALQAPGLELHRISHPQKQGAHQHLSLSRCTQLCPNGFPNLSESTMICEIEMARLSIAIWIELR